MRRKSATVMAPARSAELARSQIACSDSLRARTWLVSKRTVTRRGSTNEASFTSGSSRRTMTSPMRRWGGRTVSSQKERRASP